MNQIPIIILKHKDPIDNNVKPALVLKADSWDDYGYKTLFYLTYRTEAGEVGIGDVKIGSADYKPCENEFIDEIMNSFYAEGTLPKKFFSLGQNIGYYRQIKRCFPDCYQEILEKLRDCVVLPTLAEEVEQKDVFKTSLLRSECRTMDRHAAQEAFDYGMDILKYGEKKLDQNFEYTFMPYNDGSSLKISFCFDGSNSFPRRLYALIGDNGVGKTTLLNDIPKKLSNQAEADIYFNPRPVLKKIITISLNQYDDFVPPERKESFNYVYCGLVDKKSGNYNQESIINRTIDSLFYIHTHSREDFLWEVLDELVDKDFIKNARSALRDYERNVSINEDARLTKENETREKLLPLLRGLSSGQHSILSVFANVFAEIRYNSLLLMDEPETHLHPQAISRLMKMLLEILEYYESFCILATHSPLIIRELTSDCVYVVDSMGTERSVRHIGSESLGANLTTLTNEIFGINEENSYYVEKIKAMKMNGKSEEEIVSLIKSKTGHSVSLNLRLFIASIFFGGED